MKIQFWDTAGAEKLRAVFKAYFCVAGGAIVIFDVTSSFYYNVNYRIDAVREENPHVQLTLIGNKCDLVQNRVNSKEEAQNRFQIFYYY